MTIFEFINEDEFLGRDISVYIDIEGAENLIDEIIENDEDIYSDFEEILEENEVVIVSKVYSSEGIEWFVDPISYDGKTQVYNETDIAFIMEDLLEEIDFNRVVCDEIVVLSGQDDEEIEHDCLDDVSNDILNALAEMEDDECPHCIIKGILSDLVSIVEGYTVDKAMEKICELYKDN